MLQQELRLEEKGSGNFSVASLQTQRKITCRAAKSGFENLRAGVKTISCSQRHTNARYKKKTLSAVFAHCAILQQQEKNLVLPRRFGWLRSGTALQSACPAAPGRQETRRRGTPNPAARRPAERWAAGGGFPGAKKRTAALAGGRISYDIAFILRPACNRPARGDCRSCAHFPRQCLQGFPDRRRSDSRCP